MNKFIKVILLSFIGFVGLNTTLSAQQKTDKLAKSPNFSLNASGSGENANTSYFNLGFATNIPRLQGIGINVFTSLVRQKASGLRISGLANFVGLEANGIQIAGITNVSGYNTKGLHIAGLMNVAGNKLSGIQISAIGNVAGNNLQGLSIGGLINLTGGTSNAFEIAGLANFTARHQSGFSLAGLINVSGDGLSGVQTAGLLNVDAKKVKGIQIAGISNIAVNAQGLQLAALTNVTTDTLKGLQIAGAVNIGVHALKAFQFSSITNIVQQEMEGVQVGIANYAGDLKGAQIGVLNLCGGDVNGVQIGLINHSKDTTALKIGLVNINPKTRIQVLAYGGNLSKANIAVRFRNHSLYTMLGVGTHYLGLSEKFSGALFYRAGTIYNVTNKLALSADLGFYHIENFENESVVIPERMYSIQPRVNVEYAISRRIGLFLSGGYSWTRYYNKNESFENKPIIELGMILF